MNDEYQHLSLTEKKWEVGVVDMHFSSTWHNATAGTLRFQEKEEESTEKTVVNELEVEEEIEAILDALLKSQSPFLLDFFRLLALC